jgi:hypothetical protein
LADDRHESDAGKTSHAKSQPRNHDVEHCAVDVEQEDRKAGKEEEKRNMDKYGHSSGYPVEVQLVESFSMKCTNASSDLRTMSFLSCLKVGLSPLLYKYGYESSGETHDEAQEPE